MQLCEIDFQTIKPFWQSLLWDNRYEFEPTSAMLFMGGYNAEIATKYTPRFFAVKVNDTIAGVLSGHQTAPEHYRARGLYVLEEYRQRGVATLLLNRVLTEAKNTPGCKLLWAAPRASSLRVLEEFGFRKESEFTKDGFLYGPNCYVAIRF